MCGGSSSSPIATRGCDPAAGSRGRRALHRGRPVVYRRLGAGRAPLVPPAREVNDAKPKFVAAQIRERADRLKHPIIACLGLTYKPDVDDLRESPALDIALELARAGTGRLLLADPNLKSLPAPLSEMPNVVFCDTLEAVREADIVAILVAHSPFRRIPPDELMRRMVIDATGLTHRPAAPAP